MRGSRRKRRKMERYCNRANHSRCPSCHHSTMQQHSICPQHSEQPGRIMSFLYNVFLLTCLVAVVYLILEYHCDTCKARSNIRALTKNIDHITVGASFVFLLCLSVLAILNGTEILYEPVFF